MDTVTALVAWVLGNQEALVAAVLAIHAAALAIVNLTPTPKDDEVLAKVYVVISFLAGLVTKEGQGTKPSA